ncbi:hypothetical protein BdWA1_002497 [Babesia duncani]|uniref:Uncharacterized protein n=1 Tax=Babesia duncani TaxID=323732 RepID=A0AAD9PJ88_9APIC|nr:hypothetical protein BdWA1_002497 [Babesia duncani]
MVFKLIKGIRSLTGRPSIIYSVNFGAACAVVAYCGYFGLRAAKCQFASTDYFARQSRWRYLEKQILYQRELGQAQNASFVAALAEEYDPVALCAPGQEL